jgi:outer membrane protein insertion porin family
MDFQILDISKNLNNDNQKMDIEIQISEGIQFKLGDISFSGETLSLSSKDLRSIFSLSKGDIFNRKIIVNDIQKVIDVYSDQGYAFVDVSPTTNDFLDSIDVDVNISLNKKVYINRITISGNTRTKDEVIRREIGVSEGSLYSKSTIKNSILKLRRLGYFSDVQMDVNEIEGFDDKLDLSFKVEETKTGSLSFTVSHSNNYGASVGFGIKEKNIFGSGNTLNADLKLAESYQRSSFYFENPYFNEDGHSISYGAFLSKIDDDDIMKESYEISSKGLNFGYGIPLTENTRLNSSIEYSQNEIKCGSSFSTSDYENAQCSVKNNDEVSLNLNWNESTLNNYMYPTEGSSNQIDFNIALPVADYKYYKINAGHSSYSPISENLTLKLTGNIGIASGYGGKELPFYKRYFAGGSGSVRGFAKRSLGPEYINNKAKGGELSVLGSVNLISPAFFVKDSKNMRINTFVDAGNIFEKSSNFEFDQLRMSTGVGLAYLSPIGAIGFYWTTPILKKSGDTIENFSFSLGTGF